MNRYLVNRETQQVFIWTELLSREDHLEEVLAGSAKTALLQKATPDPKNISLAQLDEMSKAQLLAYAELRLGLNIRAEFTVQQIKDRIKMHIFGVTPEPEVQPEQTA